MSRSNYSEDLETWDLVRWRGAVKKAINGRRGQAFLREMLRTFDAMPERKLVRGELEGKGGVCALGAVGCSRRLDMSKVDVEDPELVAALFGIAKALAAEIEYENDEAYWYDESEEARFNRMREWVLKNLQG